MKKPVSRLFQYEVDNLWNSPVQTHGDPGNGNKGSLNQ